MLFQIDPRPFEHQVQQARATLAKDLASVSQAEAALARDRSTAANAQVEAARYLDLFRSGVASREVNDQYQTAAKAASDVVRADEANVGVARETAQEDRARLADAELQLSYTKIVAPVAGRTGTIVSKEGNLVQAQSATPLVTINQVSPIYVSFAVPETTLASIRARSAHGKLIVRAAPAQPYPLYSEGTLDFINNTVDPATGTIQLMGIFPNRDRRLWPGEFVNVTLVLEVQRGAVVVPSAAVETGQQGQYVFVVDNALVAHERLVVPGQVFNGNTVIQQGVLPGERVITDGQMSVTPGTRVQLAPQARSSLR
jgi:multidrug efflux system membrane fusion protein